MSKHWNPDDELADRPCPRHDLDREFKWLKAADEPARPAKAAWPDGATAGLLLVAASCVAIGSLLYQFAGPLHPIEDSVARP